MRIVLENSDLERIDKQIQDMPFKYGYPLFLILSKKIEETKFAELNQLQNGQTDTREDTTTAS